MPAERGLVLAAGAVAWVLLVAPSSWVLVAGAREPAPGREVFTFTDPRIVESSGLVAGEEVFVTVNDSGDGAVIYTVDAETGDTLGATSFAERVVDVEALSPAADDAATVWVGDIGANIGPRESITAYRVPFGRGEQDVDAAAYELLYPNGEPRDAEAMLVHPDTGRLMVLTKEVLGGTLYRAPARLVEGRPNRLERVGAAAAMPGVATDAAFFPDGRHLLVRTYSSATVYRWPGLVEVGSLELPEQPQGEAIAVAPGGRVFVSSEGVSTPVLFVPLPAELREAMAPSARPSGPTIVEVPEGFEPPQPDREVSLGPGRGNWLLGGILGVVILVVLVRTLRPR